LREQIIAALLEWIVAEAKVAPVALVVEDVHWADDTAIEALRRLTSSPLPAGLFAVITVRTDGLPTPLHGLQPKVTAVGPLSAEEAREMVRTVAVGGDLDEEAVESLARRGEGVPLFTEHLVMAAMSGARPGAAGDALPATLEGLLQARLASSGAGRGLAE